MSEGIDYSTTHPDPAQLYAAGKRFVVRYGGPGSSDKWLTADEVRALHRAGLAIVANAEGSSRGLIGGAKAGRLWAAQADLHFRGLGMPYDLPIYLSVDWDVLPSEWPTVLAAFKGATEILGTHRVGIYGGRHAIEWAQRDGCAAWFWQTYAWSGDPPHWVPGVHIHQYHNNATVAGVNCDLDRSMTVDYGQWEVTPMLELTTVIPGTAAPGFHDKDRTLQEIIMDWANLRAILFGEKAAPAGSPLDNLLNGRLVLNDNGVTAIATTLGLKLGPVVEEVVNRVGLTVHPDV